MIVQLWNTNNPVIVLRDADLTETPCTFQWILEREYMYFAGNVLYLNVLASAQFAIIPDVYPFWLAIVNTGNTLY